MLSKTIVSTHSPTSGHAVYPKMVLTLCLELLKVYSKSSTVCDNRYWETQLSFK